jgi:hypothetical protein
MKALLLAALALSISSGAQARSILVFKTISSCEAVEKVSGQDIKIDIQEAQDGQSQLVLKLASQAEVVKIQTKKILPPPMSAGTPLKYEGVDPETNGKTTLAIGARPIKVGKIVGKAATITAEGRFTNLKLVCAAVKK